MANNLPTEKKNMAVAMLAEGNSIRSIERMTGIHRDTIMRLSVRVGQGCQRLMDEKFRNLDCSLIEVDEIWGFINMKQKTANYHLADPDYDDVWTWIAIGCQVQAGADVRRGRPFRADGGPFHGRFGIPPVPPGPNLFRRARGLSRRD